MNAELEKLREPIPRDKVKHRAADFKNPNGKQLDYIDARTVMDRLDAVMGPENWMDEYRQHHDSTICRLSIRLGDEWVWKEDAAEDTNIAAAKGGISGSFKRAAVKWGIGRELYEDAPPPKPDPIAQLVGEFKKRDMPPETAKYLFGGDMPTKDEIRAYMAEHGVDAAGFVAAIAKEVENAQS